MKKFGFILIVFSLVSSCGEFQKKIDFEDDEFPTSLVLNAFPTINDSLEFEVTLSSGVLDQDPIFQKVENATVRLFENANLVQTQNGVNSLGEYKLTYPFAIGSEYGIEISHPDYSTLKAQTVIPGQVSNLSAFGEIVDQSMDIQVNFDDTPTADYYRLLLLRNGGIEGWNTNSEYFDLDPFEDASYFYNDAFFSDAAFENGTANIEMSIGYYFDQDELDILLISCSEDYFNYYKSRNAWEETVFSGPFTEPVQIYTNVENGLGIFAGYSEMRATVIY